MSKNIKVVFKESEVFFATLGLTLQNLIDIIEKQITPVLMNCEGQFTEMPIMWDKKKSMI